ncbi:response regulator [Ramlibacter sp. AN1015]|uniref:response regulator n=1 Tax=Ramlibacter sp. AN1015 TaxID=3133428 RepID=UPI0030C3744D
MQSTNCPSTPALSILIVDDNEDAVDMLSVLLETYGHRAVGAFDAEDGLRIAAELQPDIVLLDLGLPGMDGLELCRRLRRTYPLGTTCIIAITGWSDDERRRAAVAAGFDEYLVKPVDVERVLSVLHDCRATAALAAR